MNSKLENSSAFLTCEVTSPTTSRGGAAPVEGGTRSLPYGRQNFPGLRGRACTARHGYSLLEMLVYVAVFAVGANLFVSLLSSGSQLSALNTLSMSRMEGVREVQDEFTEYTRQAVSVVAEAGDFKTTADRLVLKMPSGQDGGFAYCVLGVLRDANRFAVLGLAEKDGKLEEVYMKTLRQPLETVVFEVDESGARALVNLSIKVQGEEGERKQPFVEHRASATPRGVGG